jgi:hypothetical protein
MLEGNSEGVIERYMSHKSLFGRRNIIFLREIMDFLFLKPNSQSSAFKFAGTTFSRKVPEF